MLKSLFHVALAFTFTSLPAYAAPAKEGDIDAIQCGHGPAFVSSISSDATAGSYSTTVLVVTKEGSL